MNKKWNVPHKDLIAFGFIFSTIVTIIDSIYSSISIYQFVIKNLEITIILVEFVIILILIYIIKLKSENKLTDDELRPLIAMMDPSIQDNIFEINTFEKNLYVEGSDPEVCYHFKGINKTTTSQNVLKFKLTGDCRLDRDKIKLSYGYSGFQGKFELLLESEYKFNKNGFDVTIPLKNTCTPDTEFEIWFKYYWPGSLSLNKDYIFYPCGFFNKGVNTLKSNFVFDTPLSNVNFVEIMPDNYKLKAISCRTIPVDEDQKEWEIGLDHASGFYLAEFQRKITE